MIKFHIGQKTQVWILGLPLTSCGNLSKALPLQKSSLSREVMPDSWGWWRRMSISWGLIHVWPCAGQFHRWFIDFSFFLKFYLREGERENPKQAPHTAWSLTWGSIPWPLRSWLELKSRVGRSTYWASQVPLIDVFLTVKHLVSARQGAYAEK